MDKVSRAVCSSLKEAISDERSAPSMYQKLIDLLAEEGTISTDEYINIEREIKRIISQEQDHELKLIEIAERAGCIISTRTERKEFYQFPLKERVKMAREALSRMESTH